MKGYRALIAVGIALAALMALFVYEGWALYSKTVAYARRDLKVRAELAALVLAEPLRTQDFKAIREFDADLRAREIGFAILHGDGVFYGSRADAPGWSEVEPCGDYAIRLHIDGMRILLPALRALALAGLAFLVGLAGMAFVFIAFYRQRVRIRELARLEAFRREFVADVSHEIKTPLTGILGAVEMLSDAPDDTVRARLAGMAAKEAKRLNALVQKILDLARLEREGESTRLEETDLGALVDELGAKYGVRVEKGTGPRVACDPQLVTEALSNLVENAIRHSGSREIVLSLAFPRGAVELAVEDHGIGIPPEHAARVFERFHRVDPARAAESGGAGLGLSIVRRIARLHGGDVALSDARPAGCRFTMTFPRVTAPKV